MSENDADTKKKPKKQHNNYNKNKNSSMHSQMVKFLGYDPSYQQVRHMWSKHKLPARMDNYVQAVATPQERKKIKQYLVNRLIDQNEPNFHNMSPVEQIQSLRMMVLDGPIDWMKSKWNSLTADDLMDVLKGGAALVTAYSGDPMTAMGIASQIGSRPEQNNQMVTYQPNNQMAGYIQNRVGNPVAPALRQYTPQTASAWQNTSLGTQKLYAVKDYGLQSVNTDFLRCFLAPELQQTRRPGPVPIKTALSTSHLSIPVITNSAGNVLVMIMPQNLMGSPVSTDKGTQIVSSFVCIAKDNTFSPSTGGLIGNYDTMPGPLLAYSSFVESCMVTSVTARFDPSVSLMNSAGYLQAAYFASPPNPKFTTPIPGMTLPQSDIVQNSNYYAGPITQQFRMTRFPNEEDYFTSFEATGSGITNSPVRECMAFLFTGCTASIQIGSINVTYVAEFQATNVYKPILDLDYSKPGAATISCIQNILRLEPQIWCQPMSKAQEICKLLDSEHDTSHDAVIASLMRLEYHRHIPTVVSTYNDTFVENEADSAFGLD